MKRSRKLIFIYQLDVNGNEGGWLRDISFSLFNKGSGKNQPIITLSSIISKNRTFYIFSLPFFSLISKKLYF
jgi:hypothetical protein